MTDSSETITRYYNWEGDACRVLREPDGDLSADLYRAGKGLVPTDPTEVLYGSCEISEAEYKDMVMDIIGLGNRAGQA